MKGPGALRSSILGETIECKLMSGVERLTLTLALSTRIELNRAAGGQIGRRDDHLNRSLDTDTCLSPSKASMFRRSIDDLRITT